MKEIMFPFEQNVHFWLRNDGATSYNEIIRGTWLQAGVVKGIVVAGQTTSLFFEGLLTSYSQPGIWKEGKRKRWEGKKVDMWQRYIPVWKWGHRTPLTAGLTPQAPDLKLSTLNLVSKCTNPNSTELNSPIQENIFSTDPVFLRLPHCTKW